MNGPGRLNGRRDSGIIDIEMGEPEAAVAIVHARGAEESVLLIRRSERADDPWSGHWSFPGGRREPEDEDLVHTALRELAEECGIRLERVCLEASLPPTSAGRRVGRVITVAPFLFRAEGELPTVLDPNEAAEAVWIPLSLLRDPARHCLRPVPRLPQEMAFPAIELNGVPLWGFTYRVITEWLGLHAPQPSPQQAGFDAARLVLEFLLARGLTLAQDWAERGGTMVAVVDGPIPVAAVRERFAFPGGRIPPVSLLEVRSECILIAGWAREEYVIEGGVG
jgi:8-oxo-dGTP pyrophosphatase MutT (NUDIX family)